MKVLFISAWYPHPADNGSKIRVRQLIRSLSGDHHVSLISFAGNGSEIASSSELDELCDSIDVVPHDPFTRRETGTWSGLRTLTPIVNRKVERMTDAVRRKLTQEEYDLVIASTTVTAAYALMADERVARILEEHNSMSRWRKDSYLNQESAAGKMRQWIGWQKLRLYESLLFRQFDLCTMVSDLDRQSSLSLPLGFNGPIAVVPNGVDLHYNQPGTAEVVPNTLVYNGSLTYEANLEAVRYFQQHIIAQVRQEVPGVTLRVTGSKDSVDTSIFDEEGLIKLTGYLEDVRPVISSSWACIVPLQQGGGTRLKVLEALALGTPVVATSKGVEGLELVPGRDVLVADNPQEFSRLLIQLLTDAEIREQLSVNGRKRVEERYDWETIGSYFVDLCCETVQRKELRG